MNQGWNLVWAVNQKAQCPTDFAVLALLTGRIDVSTKTTRMISWDGISEILGCAQSTVGRSVNRLINKGLIEVVRRSPHEGTAYRINVRRDDV